MLVNVWFGMRKTATEVVKTRLRWDEESQGAYAGPITDREHKLFRYMSDLPNVQRMYRESRIGGNPWVLWTLGIEARSNVLKIVKAELDALILKYPTQVAIAGAWIIEYGKPFSRQVGTQYLIEPVEQFINDPQFNQPDVANPDYQPDPDLPNEDNRETIPDPTWVAPRPWPQISNGFADEITGVTGSPTYAIPTNALLKFMPDVGGNPATVLTDVNVGQGWAPRRFA